MMTLYEKIKALYPQLTELDFLGPITLTSDAQYGEYIAKWEHPTLAQPTAEQLTAITGPSAEALVAANRTALQRELDRQAQLKGYDNIVSACSYASDDPNDPFAAEGRAYRTWRSAVWAQAYAVLAEVNAGQRPMPTPEEAVAMMPALVLP